MHRGYDMVVDLKARYDYYNDFLFDGELPDINLRYSRKMRILRGLCRVNYRKINGIKKILPETLEIAISSVFSKDERSVDQILIHEMIHAKLYLENHLGEGHCPVFVRIAREFSKKLGFEIPEENATNFDETKADLSGKTVNVFIGTKPCGQQSVGFTDSKFAQKVDDRFLEAVKKIYGFESIQFKTTSEPKYVMKSRECRMFRSLKTVKFYYA